VIYSTTCRLYKNLRLSLQPFQRYRWCPPKFKWFTWPDHAPFSDDLSSVG